jgi:dihydroorotase
MNYDLIIKNAKVLVPKQLDLRLRTELKIESLDVAIKNGKIADIGSLSTASAGQIIDAKHWHLLPGVIDSQVHFREPGLTHKEDLESGTRGALLGGITCVFEMPNTSPSTTNEENFRQKLDRAQNRCHTNYAFFIGGSPDNYDKLSSLERLPHCSGVKVFMGSSTGTLLVEDDNHLEKILNNTRRRVIFHCEDEFRLRERKKLFANSTDPKDHPHWRDEESALLATKRIVMLAQKTRHPIHVLHVTTQQEMQFLANYKDFATVEVLPQHLTLSAPECYERWGAFAQQNPPIRSQVHQDALWKAISENVVDVIGSDHAPHTFEEKNRPYPQTPSGMPGVQTILPVMLDHVNNGRLSLEKLTQMMTENVRDIFKLKNKGRIQIGMDADFTLVDIKKKMQISNRWIASKSQWSIFDGKVVTGWPTMAIVNGKIAMREDQIVLPHSGEGVEFEL